MQCTKCDREAVTHAAYAGTHLCETHFRRSVEKRVRSRVREDGLLPDDATPDSPTTWVLGLSGGKDSVVLGAILQDTFAEDPRVQLHALTVHEGIDGYRDESVEAAETFAESYDVPLELVAYEDEHGVRMDDVAEEDPENMAPCAYCGVFRRDVLERYADELGADLLLTGHNLDDEAQTALMNVLEGDVDQIAKHFEASLGPIDDRADQDEFVPRAKPLRDVPESEVALYAHLRDLPAQIAECPHAEEAYRGEIKELLHELEDGHPGTRHSILSGYEELAKLAADARENGSADVGECERCGASTARDVCRTCSLLS
ncbi:TIGR00269 family protein [Salinarchaeum chitinilyticum]